MLVKRESRIVSTGPSEVKCFTCGIVAGTLQCAVFNPWDRALYLSHLHKRKFLLLTNFANPYEGMGQSLVQRVITGGLYFPLEDAGKRALSYHGFQPSAQRAFFVGSMVGCINAMIINPLVAVKYRIWGSAKHTEMLATGISMFKQGGLAPFYKGLSATIIRDVIWSSAYATLRYMIPTTVTRAETSIMRRYSETLESLNIIQEDHTPAKPGTISLISNSLAALIATILSAPFNFTRNTHLSTHPSKKPKSQLQILRQLWKESGTRQPKGTDPSKTVFDNFIASLQFRRQESRIGYLGRRMFLGWGTFRVALGFGFASQVYNGCVNMSFLDETWQSGDYD